LRTERKKRVRALSDSLFLKKALEQAVISAPKERGPMIIKSFVFKSLCASQDGQRQPQRLSIEQDKTRAHSMAALPFPLAAGPEKRTACGNEPFCMSEIKEKTAL
jgi:hypothetical protein